MKSSTILGLAMLAALRPRRWSQRCLAAEAEGEADMAAISAAAIAATQAAMTPGTEEAATQSVGTWHNDGYHADPYWSGYGGAAAVNHYYANGCYNCGGYGNAGWASATALATGYAIGTTVVTPPSGRECQHRRSWGSNTMSAARRGSGPTSATTGSTTKWCPLRDSLCADRARLDARAGEVRDKELPGIDRQYT